MTDQAPATAVEAQARLAVIIADKDQGAKIEAGDPAARREFHELIAKASTIDDSTVEEAMTGKFRHGGGTTRQQEMAAMADMLREQGFPDKAIRETLADKEPPAEDVERARLWKTQALKSQDFTKRLLDGDGEAFREMTAANIVLTAAGERDAIRAAAGETTA